MSEMNGVNVGVGAGAAPHANQDVINELTAALAAAKAGEIISLAAIAIDRAGGMRPVIVGAALPHMYTGVGIVQGIILSHIANPQNQSRIIRPVV